MGEYLSGNRTYVAIVFAAALAVLAAGLFTRVMNYDMRNDEQLYAAPTVLLDNSRLYEDVFYNHVPGSAWMFDAVQDITGSDHMLFTARLTVFLAWVFFGGVIIWSTLTLTGSLPLTILMSVLLLSNQYLLGPTGVAATNNFLPLPLIYLGLVLFVLGVQRAAGEAVRTRAPAAAFTFAAGVCISLATAIKISAGVFVIAVAAGAFLAGRIDGWSKRIKDVIGPLAAGGLLAAAPVILVALRDVERFFAHVLHYNTGPHRAYWRQAVEFEPGVAMSLPGKAILAHQIFFTGANLVLIAALAIVVIAQIAQRGVLGAIQKWDWTVYFVGATAALAMAFSFMPTPSFPQYFSPPLITGALLLVVLFRFLDADQTTFARSTVLGLAFAGAVVGAPRIAQDLPSLVRPASWTVNVVHRDGDMIASALQERGLDGPVAAIFPIYALEGGLTVYPELATGPFAYRVGDIADPELLKHYVTTSPARIGDRMREEPPAAILLGFSPILEQPLLEFARAEGYRKAEFTINNRYGSGELYLRPGGSEQPQR